jgi:hypothetical protein
MIKITGKPISPEKVVNEARTDDSGCVVTYVGLIRDNSRGKQVLSVEYTDTGGKAEAGLRDSRRYKAAMAGEQGGYLPSGGPAGGRGYQPRYRRCGRAPPGGAGGRRLRRGLFQGKTADRQEGDLPGRHRLDGGIRLLSLLDNVIGQVLQRPATGSIRDFIHVKAGPLAVFVSYLVAIIYNR